MASSPRLSAAACRVLSKPASAPYICRNCKHQQQQFRRPNAQQRRHASDSLPLTERIRRKIWGTSDPPEVLDVQPSSETITGPVVLEYKEAETRTGLKEIGYLKDWRHMRPNPDDDYTSWINTSAPKRASSRAELLSCLYQAIVECYIYKSLGRNPAQVCQLEMRSLDVDKLFAHNIVRDEGGFISAVETTLPISGLENAENEAVVVSEEQKQTATYYVVPDESFLEGRLNFSDPVTFTILKRFTQLSKHPISDPVLTSFSNPESKKPLSFLLNELVINLTPKPKRLAERLAQNSNLARQSNLVILSKKETHVDKDREAGRLKVILEELGKRDLPVYSGYKSRKWKPEAVRA